MHGVRVYSWVLPPTLGEMELRDLPSVDELVRDERLAGEPSVLALAAARAALARAREEIMAGHSPGDLAERALQELAAARAPSLRRALNATGVIVHTNLGRAPLPEAALERAARSAAATRTSSTTSTRGARGSRQDHVAAILRRLTGAEAALVVNNNAAAVLLALAALAEGREVLVSSGELIEIGDGFRIPDVLARSGARLREVGTTNRTRAADYERAIGPETALLLRVHQSNFRVVGFTEQPPCPSSPQSRAATSCRSSTTSARARSFTSRTSRPRRRASPRAPTSSASPATSCSADRRPASSSGAPSSSNGSAATRSSARCGSTS